MRAEQRATDILPGSSVVHTKKIEDVSKRSDIYYYRPHNASPNPAKPLLIYLPGITGLPDPIRAQRDLLRYFDVCAVRYPFSNRDDWGHMVASVVKIIEAESGDDDGGQRAIHLMGDSFGGCLALLVAEARPDLVDRLVLVNPATSFQISFLASVFRFLRSVPRLLPFTAGPYLALTSADPLTFDFEVLLSGSTQLPGKFPTEALIHRAGLLDSFDSTILKRVQTPVFLIASTKDRLLPSHRESKRLKAVLPNCEVHVVQGGPHSLTSDVSVDFLEILQSHQFPLLRKAEPRPAALPKLRAPAAKDPFEEWWNRNHTASWEFPDDETVDKFRPFFNILKRLHSPVFIGLDAIPRDTGRPLLFVGNHTLLGLIDTFLLLEKLNLSGDMIVRPLAHPLLMVPHLGSFNFFEAFGSVPSSGRNLYRLLSSGQNVLLFPGGIREAFRGRGKEHQLQWNKHVDFVRMAARHDAIIVPFASVGPDDSYVVLKDPEELRRLPLVGEVLDRWTQTLERLHVLDGQDFVLPLAVPGPPARFYFRFGQPIDTLGISPDASKDDFRALYASVRESVEQSLDELLQVQKEDPYSNPFTRLLVEGLTGSSSSTPSR